MIITIAGDAGSGKSTVRRMLAQHLGWPSYSMGDLFGRMAQERGMTIEAFNALCEERDDIDREIDTYTETLGRTEDNFLIDGWIAWHFIPHSFKVFLRVDPVIGATRILGHIQSGGRTDEAPYTTVEEVQKAVSARIASHATRFQAYYGIQWDDLTNMDLVIDTSHTTPEEVVQQIIDKIAQKT